MSKRYTVVEFDVCWNLLAEASTYPGQSGEFVLEERQYLTRACVHLSGFRRFLKTFHHERRDFKKILLPFQLFVSSENP